MRWRRRGAIDVIGSLRELAWTLRDGDGRLRSPPLRLGECIVTGSTTKRPLYGHLYVQVLTGIALGVIVGYLWPHAATTLKPLGDGFIRLITHDDRARSSSARSSSASPRWAT